MSDTLAYHETLELHELVALQSNSLMRLKKSVGDIKDQELKNLYLANIKVLEKNLRELMRFFPKAPTRDVDERNDNSFYAGGLLGMTKTLVRNYAIAITETATPVLRKTLTNQLNGAIDLHAQVFNYMYKKGMYPVFDMKKLINNDIKNANEALAMKY